MDEILVKGVDGKWYIARDGKLIPQDDVQPEKPAAKTAPVAVQTPPRPVAPKTTSAKPAAPPQPIQKQSPQETAKKMPVLDVIKQPEIVAPQAKVVLQPASAPHMDASDDMEAVITQAVIDAKLNFPDPSLTKRFKLLVASRLREVRRAEDVMTLLTRETKVGGLGLTEDDAQRALGIIEKAFTEFHKKWEQVEAERKAAVIKAREEAAKKVQKIMTSDQVSISNEAVQEKKEPSTAKRESKVEPFQKTNIPQKNVRAAVIQPSAPKGVSPTPAAKKPVAPLSAPSAPTVTDIRKPKLFGPADELREMRLVDFRRMGTPVEAVNRIKAKIDLMGSESLAKRREAQAAWRQSEVYRVYTDMMGAAMARGKAIDVEVSERARSGKNSLTIDEIDAIMGFNEQLRNP